MKRYELMQKIEICTLGSKLGTDAKGIYNRLTRVFTWTKVKKNQYGTISGVMISDGTR